MKAVLSMAILGFSFSAGADWLQDNFAPSVANEAALQAAAADAQDVKFDESQWNERRTTCAGLKAALATNASNFLNLDQHKCYTDSDCGVGYIGGFCGGVYPKAALAGYKAFTESTLYEELYEKWSKPAENFSCWSFEPVGLCVPPTSVSCQIPEGEIAGNCKGNWGDVVKPLEEQHGVPTDGKALFQAVDVD